MHPAGMAIAAIVLLLAACADPTLPTNGGTAGFSTPPVIADYGNNRVVRFDDMEGTGWVATDISGSPSDAVVDADGRIWIGLEFTSSSGMWTIAGFDSLEAEPVVASQEMATVTAFTVDAAGGFVYAAGELNGSRGLVRLTIDAGEGELVDPEEIDDSYLGDATLFRTSGLHYAGGALYAVTILDGGDGPDTVSLFKVGLDGSALAVFPFDDPVPDGLNWLGRRYLGDVTVRNGRVYVADAIGGRIIELDTDLEELGRFGIPYDKESEDPIADLEFYGPSRFAALPPEDPWFVVLDETKDGFPRVSRVVRFSDMTGSNWAAYGEHGAFGADEGEFAFFDFC